MPPSTSVELTDLLQIIGELYVQRRMLETKLAETQAAIVQRADESKPVNGVRPEEIVPAY